MEPKHCLATKTIYLLRAMGQESFTPSKEGKPRIGRRAGGWLLGGLLAIACGGPPPRAANPTRPLDERRAVDVIARAFRNERDQPGGPKQLELADGNKLEVDVTSAGHKYGVAYITPLERRQLANSLPARDPSMGDALQLVRGTGPDADTRILILHDENYRYDDQVGTKHESTTITAERKLARDVQDFLVRAHAEHWP